MGRITWESVGRGFLELWGLHTRSCGVLFPIPVVVAIFIVVGISRACIKYQLKKDAAIEQQEELKDVAEDENTDQPS